MAIHEPPHRQAVRRYRQMLERDHRRLVAVGPGHHLERERPAWVALTIDFVVTPLLVALAAGMAATGSWWVIPAGLAHLAVVYAFLRWG